MQRDSRFHKKSNFIHLHLDGIVFGRPFVGNPRARTCAIYIHLEITGSKVELEALYTLGMDALTGRFLETAVCREDFI